MNKTAPIQGLSDRLPWEIHLKAYSEYVKKYNEQPALIDLEKRNCRGGFYPSELDKFIPGWRDGIYKP